MLFPLALIKFYVYIYYIIHLIKYLPFQFNVSIPDSPDIEDLLKKSLKDQDVKTFPPKVPICVEVALVTSEGDHMFLETWDLSFNRSSLDMAANRRQHIFTRMGMDWMCVCLLHKCVNFEL